MPLLDPAPRPALRSGPFILNYPILRSRYSMLSLLSIAIVEGLYELGEAHV